MHVQFSTIPLRFAFISFSKNSIRTPIVSATSQKDGANFSCLMLHVGPSDSISGDDKGIQESQQNESPTNN